MKHQLNRSEISRRDFFRVLGGGVLIPAFSSFRQLQGAESASPSDLFWVKKIPDQPFYSPGRGNYHVGLDSLIHLMGTQGLKFYRSSHETGLSGPLGLIAADDVVLVKVNAQWKYRGATNSDLIRGLIQRILDHLDVFNGEVVIFENGQGRGSLNCDTSSSYGGDTSVRANANDERHSFLYLVNQHFKDPRVSAFLLDPVRSRFISNTDHSTNGYRLFENVSYPCFTTAGGHRVELKEGIRRGNGYSQNLKLINVPVLKYHDVGGSEITVALKHLYGVLSMSDGQSTFRHYSGLGETCGKMVVSVCPPVLNIVDAIWVSHKSLAGHPASTTFRANQVLAGQDPVALDYYAAKYILYPIEKNSRHHPDFTGVDRWLTQARNIINLRGGLRNVDKGILVGKVTKSEGEMRVFAGEAKADFREALIRLSDTHLKFIGSSSTKEAQEGYFELSNAGTGPFTWKVETDAGWIACVPTSGQGSGRVAVRLNPWGLASGLHTGSVKVVSPESLNSPQTVAISLNVRAVEGKDSDKTPVKD